MFFVGLVLILGSNLSRLDHDISARNTKLAQQELIEALTLLNDNSKHLANIFANWDESRQQLADSAYYSYWRNSRALSANMLPATVSAVDLYDKDGKKFLSGTGADSEMPDQAFPPQAGALLKRDNGHDHIYRFEPIYADQAHHHLLGYGGIKMDFLVELQALRKFRYIDLQSIHINSREGVFTPISQLAPYMKYQIINNPESEALKQLTARTVYGLATVVLIAAIVAYLFARVLFAAPLSRLSKHIDAMRAGRSGLLGENYRGLFPVTELEKVRASLNDYQARLEDMHSSLAHKNEELWVMAHHDPLTGVFNRRAFEDDWQALCSSEDRSNINLCFLIFDCDHFKAINDTYGHQIGDQVLQGIAQSLHDTLRVGDRLYRLGGDEFATLLYETDIEPALRISERCVEAVNSYDFFSIGVNEPVQVSAGLSHTTTTEGLPQLHRNADIAMYQAKRPGQKKIAVYSDTLNLSMLPVLSTSETSAVYQAISNPNQIEMHYQRVVNLVQEGKDYFEALVRIRDGDRLLLPSQIFPVVEAKRFETDFDLAVLERVRMDLDSSILPRRTGISINIAGPSIISQDIITKLMELAPFMRHYKLVIEITETSLITQIGHASTNLNRLRKAGFIIALDDFGSGYSSLRYLSSMPVDLVKFDITMIQCLEKQDRQSTIVENLARLVREAGYELVAEGIETEGMLQKIRELGFSHGQGYYLGRPQPINSIS